MPVQINGVTIYMPLIYVTREEAAPRFEICGKCKENKGGICDVIKEPIRQFIYYEPSGCPLNLWPQLDLGRPTIRDIDPKCCP